jgi:cytochrome c2
MTRVAAIVATVALGLGVSVIAMAQAPADPARGREMFTAKQCARCHRPEREGAGTGPPLERLKTPQGAYALAGRLWNHAPAMFTVLTWEGVAWPTFTQAEMADLMAYLEADPARDRSPDLSRGQRVLVSKGCLKCHAWKREGARLGPDLAQRTANYAPASRWAATMWSHTPRMAVVALERGIMYPRFTGDEMMDLLAFLRSGTDPLR